MPSGGSPQATASTSSSATYPHDEVGRDIASPIEIMPPRSWRRAASPCSSKRRRVLAAISLFSGTSTALQTRPRRGVSSERSPIHPMLRYKPRLRSSTTYSRGKARESPPGAIAIKGYGATLIRSLPPLPSWGRSPRGYGTCPTPAGSSSSLGSGSRQRSGATSPAHDGATSAPTTMEATATTTPCSQASVTPSPASPRSSRTKTSPSHHAPKD